MPQASTNPDQEGTNPRPVVQDPDEPRHNAQEKSSQCINEQYALDSASIQTLLEFFALLDEWDHQERH